MNAYIVSSQMNSLSKLVFQISIEKLYLLVFHEQWYFRSLNECSQNLRRFLSVVIQYSRVKCACVSSKYSHSWIYTIRTPKTYAEIKVRSDQGVILPAQSHFGMKTRHRQRLLLQESNDQLIFPTVGPEWKPAYIKFLPYKQQLPHLKPSNNPLVRSYFTSQIIKYWEW